LAKQTKEENDFSSVTYPGLNILESALLFQCTSKKNTQTVKLEIEFIYENRQVV